MDSQRHWFSKDHAGGVKVTTFRLIWAFVVAELKGRHQVVIG
jgi:hypothetical protein